MLFLCSALTVGLLLTHLDRYSQPAAAAVAPLAIMAPQQEQCHCTECRAVAAVLQAYYLLCLDKGTKTYQCAPNVA
jgi:hypothetical protein